ncbi:unnamed protein product, partial [Symbiodinium necroappetens]
ECTAAKLPECEPAPDHHPHAGGVPFASSGCQAAHRRSARVHRCLLGLCLQIPEGEPSEERAGHVRRHALSSGIHSAS